MGEDSVKHDAGHDACGGDRGVGAGKLADTVDGDAAWCRCVLGRGGLGTVNGSYRSRVFIHRQACDEMNTSI